MCTLNKIINEGVMGMMHSMLHGNAIVIVIVLVIVIGMTKYPVLMNDPMMGRCSCYDETESLSDCLQTDYHFEYTECDSSGSRWRVAVPNPAVECSGLPDPVKGKECSMFALFNFQLFSHL